MTIEDDKDETRNAASETDAGAETADKPEPRPERELREERVAKQDIRSTIKAAIKQHAGDREQDRGTRQERRAVREREAGARKVIEPDTNPAAPEAEASKEAATEAGGKPIPAKDDGKETTPAPQAQAAPPVPAALSKEVKAQWEKLDPVVRNEFLRREADTAKGIEKLKETYKGYDDALSPLHDELRSVGRTPAEGIKMLAEWRRALSGPNKVQAFAALAKLENVDLSQLVPKPPAPAAQSPNPTQSPTDPQQPDPAQLLRPYLDPLSQKLTSLETELQRRDRAEAERQAQSVQRDIQSFAKDKPHFAKVSRAMGYLMHNGQVTGETAQEAFDNAYVQACWADPEIRASLQGEEQAKRDADAETAREKTRLEQEAAARKAAEAEAERKRKASEEVARARKAAVGPRGGSPVGMATTSTSKGQTVGDSLRAAIKEVRAAI